MRYRLPGSMRYSMLNERKEYYADEFNFGNVKKWFKERRDALQTVYAVMIGRHTNIYPKRFTSDYRDMIIIDEYANSKELIDMFTFFKPESVYYNRNYCINNKRCLKCTKNSCWSCKNMIGQEMAFDIDPENVECPKHGGIDQKIETGQALGFCIKEFEMVKEQAELLYERLSKNFSDIGLVYSGRGMHIHVFDSYATKMARKERKKLGDDLLKEGYAIDEWVTNGEMKYIRLPYSLHGMVSRIVTPIEKKDLKNFDPIKNKKYWPKFMI